MSIANLLARRFGQLALLIIGALLLAACSPSAQNPSTSAPTSQFGPLDEYLFQIRGSRPDATQAARQARESADHRAREEMISACMAEQGFLYIPWLEGAVTVTVVSADDGLRRGSRDFAEQLGFGISTNTWGRIAGEPSSVANMAGNPNDELRAAMSPSEGSAWDLALHGRSNLDEWWEPDWEGCSGAAWQAFSQPKQFAALQQEISTFQTSIDNRLIPDFTELDIEWASCMANQGFTSVQSPSLLERTLFYENMELQGNIVINDEFGTRWEASGQVADIQQQLAFTDREIAMAIADYDCRRAVSYEQRHNEIDFALQQAFVAQHRDELDAWVEYINSIRAGY